MRRAAAHRLCPGCPRVPVPDLPEPLPQLPLKEISCFGVHYLAATFLRRLLIFFSSPSCPGRTAAAARYSSSAFWWLFSAANCFALRTCALYAFLSNVS